MLGQELTNMFYIYNLDFSLEIHNFRVQDSSENRRFHRQEQHYQTLFDSKKGEHFERERFLRFIIIITIR